MFVSIIGDFSYSSLGHDLIIQTKDQIDKLVITACFQYGFCGTKVRGEV
jgi:hypothetical protein